MFGVVLDHAPRLEGLEREGVDELLERDAVLQTLGDGDGEAREDALEGRTLLGQVDEDLAEGSVLVFAGAEIDLVATDHCASWLNPERRGRQLEPWRLHPLGVGLGRGDPRWGGCPSG